MKFLATVRKTGKSEIINQEEIMFRLMGRKNRPQDLSDLMRGEIVHTDYSDYQKIEPARIVGIEGLEA